ncbi:cell division protein FtsI (penicillin-binding protein 3) [Cyclonatronum proteinivorum]|uniref:Cell division protein FtsI (Penicillin-binding protein 3) n=1 Tax=Cyclonatronum proteinivorum TaxID=1457365 RepID=A0A345UIP0_9BACT|nr:penicillin-binding protein [Cyclonatronum proteinivorum]AXJ00342.1 cell division protein FtsI (penicillin-binding protein 3) [Cyclonatronum proteinivorum]
MKPDKNALAARLLFVLGALLILPVAIILQMLRIQYVEGDGLRELWSRQTEDAIPIQSRRGQILDSNGRVLVTNIASYAVAVDPHVPNLEEGEIQRVLAILAHFTNRSQADYMRMVRQAPANSRYIVLGRNFDRAVYDSLRAHRFRSLILEERFRRHYTYDDLAAHVMGYVNHEVRGMDGLERAYDELLRGRDGQRIVRRDSRGRIRQFVRTPIQQPQQGHNLITTLDAQIQAIAQQELREGIARTGARHGSVIIVEPATGAVIAMANYPDFNPNRPGTAGRETRRNAAIADMIEPGSTFKLVAAVAAYEQGVVQLDEVFYTPENGARRIYGQTMRDHIPLGDITFRQAIERSSNIATAEAAMRVDRDQFFQYVRNFGFGALSSIDLPNEESGRLRRPLHWSGVTQPWMSIGYEIQVTPLQLVMAYASIANGGRLMRPYVVDHVQDESGRVVQQNRPTVIRQSVRPETVEALRPAFQNVVSEDGTARLASVAGLSIAGKTGTAQKFIDGRYQQRYRASFVGYFPAEAPRYAMIVLLDEPQTSIFGGTTAGIVFREITRRIMGVDPQVRNLVQRTLDEEAAAGLRAPQLTGLYAGHAQRKAEGLGLKVAVSGEGTRVASQYPAAGQEMQENQLVRLQLETIVQGEAGEDQLRSTVPDVRGLSMREAVAVLHEAGYDIQRNGSGTVAAQFPEAGAVMQRGRPVIIRGRAPGMEMLISDRGGG